VRKPVEKQGWKPESKSISGLSSVYFRSKEMYVDLRDLSCRRSVHLLPVTAQLA
jgi:hypothetical protein